MALTGCTLVGNGRYNGQGDGGAGGSDTLPTAGTETISSTGTDLFPVDLNAPSCCVQAPPAPFKGPSWFQIGPPGSLGPCPGSTTPGIEGYADMSVAPHTCPECTCSPAACALPQGVHTNAAKCPGDGSVTLPFGPDTAAGWEGACSDEGALPPNLQCNGKPCIQSLSIPALPVAACEALSGPAPPPPLPSWGRAARECLFGPEPGEECEAGQVCAPEPQGGLSLCVFAELDAPYCPSEYPERAVFSTGFDDTRGCKPCQCSPQEGAQCAAIFSAFSDAACGSLVVAVLVSDGEPTCTDVVSGTSLGSAEAALVLDVAGSCDPSGGAPFGEVNPAGPLTLCCQGDPAPPG